MPTLPSTPWQEKLANECAIRKWSAPVYNIVSDRRGGRTAWSATVTVNNRNFAARYWYDGQYLLNAKEDAAEVAWKGLFGTPGAPPVDADLGALEKRSDVVGVVVTASRDGSDVEGQRGPWSGRLSRGVFALLVLVLGLLMMLAGFGLSLWILGLWV